MPRAAAVPASPELVVVVQPDGSVVRLKLRGDEFFSWTETEQGYAVVKDKPDGFWTYARPQEGDAGFVAIPGARAGEANPQEYGLTKHDLPDRNVLNAHVQRRRDAIDRTRSDKSLGGASANQISGVQSAPVARADEEPPMIEPPPEEPPRRVPVAGNASVKNVVILACFSDHWDEANGTVLSTYGDTSVADYVSLYNEIGYSDDGALGSVKDYYGEVSYGKLVLDSVVTVWVKLPREESYYHNNQGTLAADAVDAAEAAGFDFSQADMDGDGWVDCLDVIHSGYGEEAGGGLHPDWIWSVKGNMSSVKTYDGVSMKLYHTEPAFRGNSGTGITRIGVICHETGHFFGLPDLYDYSNETAGIGNWGLMSGGVWNNSGIQPAHFSAWSKVFLGFAQTVPIHSENGVSLQRVEDNPVVGLMRDGTSGKEYFLIENRAKVGFDNTANIYPGLVVYHIYGDSNNNDKNNRPHPVVKIEEADGNDSLGTKTASSEAGDVWTSTSGLAGGFRDQTGSTNTSAMIYQAGEFYTRTNNAASYTYNRLSNFSAAGATMTFNATTLIPVAPTQNALASADFNVSWAACAEAMKYEIQEGANVTLTSFFDGAEDENAMHENWYLGGGAERVETNASYTGSFSYAMLYERSVSMLTSRKSFKVLTGTEISFRVMSHIASSGGYIKCQISNDDGGTWQTLGTYNGYINTWPLQSFDYTAINAAGISDGDTCILRFVADIENTSGWAGYPYLGFALDDISITDTEIDGYGNWATLDNNVTTNTYEISAKSTGTYSYRMRAYANGAWQDYGPAGETSVGGNHAPSFTADPIAGADGAVGAAYSGDLSTLVNEPDVNDELTFTKISGPSWLSVAADGTLSGTPLPGNVGTNAFTMRVTDLASAFDEAQVNIFVGPPSSALSADLVAYLPFDADFQDYSGRGNHPTQSGSNSRTSGNIGASGYVLNSAGYLSFGMADDLRFPNTTEGNATSFSVSFWAKIPSGTYSGEPPFIANKDWALDANTGWALASGSSDIGCLQMNFKESNANSRDYNWTTDPGSGWHHFLVVFKRNPTRTCVTYVDGTQADSRTMYASGVNIDGAGLPVNIGQDGTGAGSRGTWSGAQIDDFGFWRRELLAADAAAIYAGGTNGYSLAYAEAAPVITNLTSDLTLAYGSATSLNMEAYSATALSYQWRTNGTPITGATGSSLSITNDGPAAVLAYDVVTANSYGTTTSRVIAVTFLAPASSTVEQVGSYAGWPTSWIAVDGLNDPNDSPTSGPTTEFVGDSGDPCGYYAFSSEYVFFRQRVQVGTVAAGSTFHDAHFVLIDVVGQDFNPATHALVDSQDGYPDYAFTWDSKSNDNTQHGLEMAVRSVVDSTWGGVKMDDLDQNSAEKLANDINGDGRTADGYVRTIDQQGTTAFGMTTFIDYAVSWDYLQTHTGLDSNQEWRVAFAAVSDATDHDFLGADIAGGESPSSAPTTGWSSWYSTPTSSGMELYAYKGSAGIIVEFVLYDVQSDGEATLVVTHANGTRIWTGVVPVVAVPRQTCRLTVPGLNVDGTYNFAVRDEVGTGWSVPGVTVASFASEMIRTSPAGTSLTFRSLPGHRYDVQWCDQLGGKWQTVTSLEASDWHTSVLVTSPAPATPTGFFRVVLE